MKDENVKYAREMARVKDFEIHLQFVKKWRKSEGKLGTVTSENIKYNSKCHRGLR